MPVPNPTIEYPHPYNLIGDGPEGPEVKQMVDFLQFLVGQTVQNITITQKSRFKSIDFQSLIGQKLLKLTCKGKMIVFWFTDICLVSTLGMEGRWVIKPEKHSDLSIHLNEPLYFDDSRHFGTIRLTSDPTDLLQKLGPDLLSQPPTQEEYLAISRSRYRTKIPIGEFLMEQKYLSGIGNYLRAEILYQSKINPFRTISELSDEELLLIFQNATEIILKAYQAGGLTIYTYHHPDGQTGKFVTQVYGHKSDPLGHPVVRQTDRKSRTVHWVPKVQL